MRSLAVATCVLFALLACGPSQSTGPTGQPFASGSEGPTVPPGTASPAPATAAPEYPAAIVDPVIADAAARASVDEAEVSIISYEAVTWPDGSLGCPQPDMGYIQVQIEGYKLVVLAGGIEYDYRGSGAGDFMLCEHLQPLPGTMNPRSY